MTARENGRSAIKNSILPIQWEKNKRSVDEIIKIINNHPIKNHQLTKMLLDESLSLNQLLLTHSEFKYTFSEVFAELLLKLMLNSNCLYERTGNMDAVVAARFIIQINLLDELGYKPGVENNNYIGDPTQAHFNQLRLTMKSLNITESDYIPSSAAVSIRQLLEDSTGIDLAIGAALLFASEFLFPMFANTFARNLSSKAEYDTSKGFHSIHTDDDEGENIEDEHSGDCLHLLILAVTNTNLSLIHI